MAEVTVQIFKAMNQTFAQQTDAERQALAREFKIALLAYLGTRLRA